MLARIYFDHPGNGRQREQDKPPDKDQLGPIAFFRLAELKGCRFFWFERHP